MISRPYVRKESVHITEARSFGAALQFLVEKVFRQPPTEDEKKKDSKDSSVSHIFKLCMIRPGARGRLEIFEKHLARRGGLIGLGAYDLDDLGQGEDLAWDCRSSYGKIRWSDVFTLAYAKSKELFELDGTGEQVFAAPSEHNCFALLDDVSTPELLIDGAAGLSMETSTGNFQHLYAFDRILIGDERAAIQRALYQHAQAQGLGGDIAAIGPGQPHRVPGSTNYKPGRGLFVTRLMGTWLPIDGATHLKADEWIRRGQGATSAAPTTATAPTPAAPRLPGLRRGCRGYIRSGHKSESEADWAWACAMAESLAGTDQGEIALLLEIELADRARPRRGRDAERYARTTVGRMRAVGKF